MTNKPALTRDELIERAAKALCETALGGKRCPCVESGSFACADEHPGKMARAALEALTPQAQTPSGDVERHLLTLRALRDSIPHYEGGDLRAEHYRERREALEAGIVAIAHAESPTPEASPAPVKRTPPWPRGETLTEACERVTREAIDESVAETADAIEARFGLALTPQDTPELAASEDVEKLPRMLRAIACDCESTDGWESAAPDLHASAALIERLRSCVAEEQTRTGLWQGHHQRELAARFAAEADLAEARAALDWFGQQRNLTLYFYSPVYGDDDDQAREWRVNKESGSINDREFEDVGRGETPLAAIADAFANLSPSKDDDR